MVASLAEAITHAVAFRDEAPARFVHKAIGQLLGRSLGKKELLLRGLGQGR
ncbi:hypothetical protein [Sorangium sp. So ce542]|uniref:hypothetical protein n=1 Tax=Sorangium sp. So ce542 TaxID=3133316 RepID=UPI003F5E83A0